MARLRVTADYSAPGRATVTMADLDPPAQRSGAYGTAELLDPFLRNAPREWDGALLDQHGAPIDPARMLARPETGLLTPEAMALREEMARKRWFLMRNVTGARSRGSGRREDYFTAGGYERPFRFPAGLQAFIVQRLDPDATTAERFDAVMGHLLTIGALEPIDPGYAEDLAMAIYSKTGRDIRREA